VLTYWVTYTEEARAMASMFRPDHAIPADSFRVEGEWMIFTQLTPDGEAHDTLKIRPEHVYRIELIEQWLADRRKALESIAFAVAAEKLDES
jgi:hypothetical protein